MNVDSMKWGEFKICDLFEIVDGYYNKKPPQDKNGTIPFLGATQYDNGITAFYEKETILQYDKVGDKTQKDVEKRVFKGNCIAITNNGSVGNAYYQKKAFVCSHDVTPIYLKNYTLNIYIALFIIPLIQQSGKSFEYAKKWRPKRMRKSKLMLPIDSKGNPNYAFMESCMRKLEQKHLTKIIKYYKNKLLDSNGGGGVIFATHLILLNLHFAIPILYPAILIFYRVIPIFCLVILSKAKCPKDITNNPALLQQSKTLQLSLRVA
ncbi:restriction endonuclease subunit S [Helicobacter bilis]|uniref:restriction endonuclease subunit S n=1 Tax=Helicobacter bilis TaxID=37372 RepID=UPI0010FDE978|nr:restriction endonuclease subunit S [Helicobacter bilis]TLE09491.1 hypothetical protein LS78_002375 [Helicobacter bilis]